MVPVHEHWVGQGCPSASAHRTESRTATSSPRAVTGERPGPAGHRAPTITAASGGPRRETHSQKKTHRESQGRWRDKAPISPPKSAHQTLRTGCCPTLFVAPPPPLLLPAPFQTCVSQISRCEFTCGSPWKGFDGARRLWAGDGQGEGRSTRQRTGSLAAYSGANFHMSPACGALKSLRCALLRP